MSDIVKRILETGEAEICQRHTASSLCKVLNRLFGSNIKFYSQYNEKLGSKEIYVAGFFDPEVEPMIGIQIYTRQRKIKIDIADFWEDISFVLYQTIWHEMIHLNQFSSRLYEKNETPRYRSEYRNYLSQSDEIDAYSHDIALEMITNYKYPKSIKLLSTPSKIRKSRTLSMYRMAFRGTDWSDVRRRLLSKAYKRITKGFPCTLCIQPK